VVSKDRRQISHFLTPVIMRGGAGGNAARDDRVYPIIEPVDRTFDGRLWVSLGSVLSATQSLWLQQRPLTSQFSVADPPYRRTQASTQPPRGHEASQREKPRRERMGGKERRGENGEQSTARMCCADVRPFS